MYVNDLILLYFETSLKILSLTRADGDVGVKRVIMGDLDSLVLRDPQGPLVPREKKEHLVYQVNRFVKFSYQKTHEKEKWSSVLAPDF